MTFIEQVVCFLILKMRNFFLCTHGAHHLDHTFPLWAGFTDLLETGDSQVFCECSLICVNLMDRLSLVCWLVFFSSHCPHRLEHLTLIFKCLFYIILFSLLVYFLMSVQYFNVFFICSSFVVSFSEIFKKF